MQPPGHFSAVIFRKRTRKPEFIRVFDFLPKRLMFPQILRSTQFDTPCLQQSRKKKTRNDCLFFENNITRGVRRRFHEANIAGDPCKRAQHCCATLRRSQTCWAKSLTGFKLYATCANIVVVPCKRTQQVTTCVVGQQCYVRLHGPLEYESFQSSCSFKQGF